MVGRPDSARWPVPAEYRVRARARCHDGSVGEMAEEDYESVKRAVGPGGSLNGLLAAWEQFVRKVETGYGDNRYEYFNDMSCRTALAKAWPVLTQKVRDARQSELNAADARFLAATVPSPGTSDREEADGSWWDDRRPVLLVGDLAEDFG
jgi:hypothetical protein